MVVSIDRPLKFTPGYVQRHCLQFRTLTMCGVEGVKMLRWRSYMYCSFFTLCMGQIQILQNCLTTPRQKTQEGRMPQINKPVLLQVTFFQTKRFCVAFFESPTFSGVYCTVGGSQHPVVVISTHVRRLNNSYETQCQSNGSCNVAVDNKSRLFKAHIQYTIVTTIEGVSKLFTFPFDKQVA